MSISAELGEQRQVQLPQGTISYRERGTGEPVVFVHGALVNADLWRKVAPRLAKDFRCIAPDLPLGSHASPMEPGAGHGVRDIRSGAQADADPDGWEPPAEDRAPRLVGA